MNLKGNVLKPMNNSVVGETMENMNNVMEMKLTTKPNTSMNHFSKPPFKHTHDILMVCILYNSINKQYYTNKPAYVGCSISDVSKLTMMKFNYDVLDII